MNRWSPGLSPLPLAIKIPLLVALLMIAVGIVASAIRV